MSWLEHRIPPPVVMLASATLMWWVDHGVPVTRIGSGVPVLSWLGWGIVLCGVSIDLYCFAGFVRRKTTVNPLRPQNTSHLVCDGFYRISRNPMYLGMALVLLGWGMVLQNLASVLGVALFVLFINRFQIEPEERALTALFGEEYLSYMRRVRRWL